MGRHERRAVGSRTGHTSRARNRRRPGDVEGGRPGARPATAFVLAGGAGQVSERTRELVDDEVRRITDECYADALSALSAERQRLDSLAEALLEREPLDELDAYRAAGLSGHDGVDATHA